MLIEKVDIQYFVNGEQIRQEVVNRPIINLEDNIDLMIAKWNEADPLPQYTTTERAEAISEEQAVLYAIALG